MLESRGKEYHLYKEQDDRNLAQQVSNTIYGLAKLGAKFKSLPPLIQQAIQESIVNIMQHMNEQVNM